MNGEKSQDYQVKDYLQGVYGFDVDGSKSSYIYKRLDSLAKKHDYTDLAAFSKVLLKDDLNFRSQVFETVTSKETSFFRDEAPFIMFKHFMMPKLESMYFERIKSVLDQNNKQIRILSAGCSSGQEAYSISIAVREYLKNDTETSTKLKDYTVTGIDISQELLQKAQKGVFSNIEIQNGLKKSHLENYFKKKARTWGMKDELRKSVDFLQGNLFDDLSHLGKFDVIFCRNVIMFFDLASRKKLIDNLSNILNPGGFLILGTLENLYEISAGFTSKMIHGSVLFEKNAE